MCRWMIGKGARHLVLVSRSVQTSEKVNELIKVASEAGAEVVIRQCDVADKEQVDFLISKNIRGMPPVRGVIHGAMVLHVSYTCRQSMGTYVLTYIGHSL